MKEKREPEAEERDRGRGRKGKIEDDERAEVTTIHGMHRQDNRSPTDRKYKTASTSTPITARLISRIHGVRNCAQVFCCPACARESRPTWC
eukprot:4477098-Pleurochrysis_carterae.AAC.2